MRIKVAALTFCTTLILALLGTPAAAGDKLTGAWSYTTSKSWRKGPCPTGGDAKGSIKIEQKKGQVTLTIESGRTCRPKSMCAFKGTLKGDKLKVSNSAKVDNEGGTAANTIELTVKSRTSATGTSSSSYSHPGGMTCKWGSTLTLTRK